MSPLKLKIISLAPFWAFKNRRAKTLVKKSKRDETKYSDTYKWNYVVKRSKKVMKSFNAEVEVMGYDNLPKGAALLTPNHQSNLDVIALIVALQKQSFEEGVQHKRCRFLAKKELEKKKSFSGWTTLCNTSFLGRDNPRESIKVLNEFGKGVKESGELGVLFPEGTRTKDGKIAPFKSGAFKVAKQEFLPIIPVTINGTKKLEDLSRKGSMKIQVIFHNQIKPMTFMSQPTANIAKRVQQVIEKQYVPFDMKKAKEKETNNKVFK